MVRLLARALAARKRLSLDTPFLDWLPLHVRGGAGGEGLPRHGGCGGDGGDVVLLAAVESICSEQDLSAVAKSIAGRKLAADAGDNSRLSALAGKRGADLLLKVPPGVVVKLENGLEAGDLVIPGQKLVVARGGKGGSLQNSFNGSAGERTGLVLVLKLIADIAVLGLPQAGKTSLIAALSSTDQAVISAPPTTTQRPRVETVRYSDGRRLTVTDLPPLSIAPTKSSGRDGRHRFLRHSERALALLYVVDPLACIDSGHGLSKHSATVPAMARNVVDSVLQLAKELEHYKPNLLNKRAMLAVAKADEWGGSDETTLNVAIRNELAGITGLAGGPQVAVKPRRTIQFDDIVCTSLKQASSIERLKVALRKAVDRAADADEGEEKRRRVEQLRQRLQRELGGGTGSTDRTYVV